MKNCTSNSSKEKKFIHSTYIPLFIELFIVQFRKLRKNSPLTCSLSMFIQTNNIFVVLYEYSKLRTAFLSCWFGVLRQFNHSTQLFHSY